MKRASIPLAASLAAASLLFASAPCYAQEDEPEPVRYPPSSVRPKLIGGGLALTAIAYGVGLVAATSWPEAPGMGSLKIPVVGPWMAIYENKCTSPGSDSCSDQVWLRGGLEALGGVVQIAGLALVVEAIVMKTEAPAPKPAETETTAFVMPMPIVTSHAVGIGLVGAF